MPLTFGKGAFISGMPLKRALSSVGRASRLHREGQRFEPVSAHHAIYDCSFIFQQGLQEHKMMMRMKKITALGLIAAATMIVAQPAFANNKERTKRTDAQSECAEARKQGVRSMSESTPQRKNDCPKTRRILM
jgi:hypothetical protein